MVEHVGDIQSEREVEAVIGGSTAESPVPAAGSHRHGAAAAATPAVAVASTWSWSAGVAAIPSDPAIKKERTIQRM